MPLYEYECDACGCRFELIRRFSDPPADTCTVCGAGPVRKLFSSPAIQFKGSGFYITDYARKDQQTAKGEKGEKGEKAEGAGSGDTANAKDQKNAKDQAPKDKAAKSDKSSSGTDSAKAAPAASTNPSSRNTKSPSE
jgi:putative FmdB family regulatory protein